MANIIWSLVTLAILLVLFLSIEKKKNASINEVVIKIKRIEGNRNLIGAKEVRQLFRNHLGFDPVDGLVNDAKLIELERLLNEDDRIKKAEVYIDHQNVIQTRIIQKQPIVRVMNSNGQSYYLDNEGDRIPTIKSSTIRVPVATGFMEKYTKDLIEGSKPSRLKEVYDLAKKINEDEFLSALIEQIHIDIDRNITLVPKIGRQKLVFGKAEEMDMRFQKLKTFYKNGLPKVGWRKHKKLDLQYSELVLGEKY